ncbi:hypothetical protein [Candidatus Tisiphia endosymbiont of Nemotelus uliginosus]|uniref:hypothetical protein n=1 Tax=Candidatus Tisiphia endosymbiont of Nemotelus uliginosus TaxID=3077926 RepID=UPI0035C91199
MNLYKLIVKPTILLLRAAGNSCHFITGFSSDDNNYVGVTKYYKSELVTPNLIEIYDYSQQLPFLKEALPLDQYDIMFAKNCMSKSIYAEVRPQCTNLTQAICTFISHTVYPMTNCIIDAVNQFIRVSSSELHDDPVLPEWLFKEENSLNHNPVENLGLLGNTLNFSSPPPIRSSREIVIDNEARNSFKKLIDHTVSIASMVLRVPRASEVEVINCFAHHHLRQEVTMRKQPDITVFISHDRKGHLKLAECITTEGDVYIHNAIFQQQIGPLNTLLSKTFKPIYIKINSVDENMEANNIIGQCLKGLTNNEMTFNNLGSQGYSTASPEGIKTAHNCIIPHRMSVTVLLMGAHVGKKGQLKLDIKVKFLVEHDVEEANNSILSPKALNISAQAMKLMHNDSEEANEERVTKLRQTLLSNMLAPLDKSNEVKDNSDKENSGEWKESLNLVHTIIGTILGIISLLGVCWLGIKKGPIIWIKIVKTCQGDDRVGENNNDNNLQETSLPNIQPSLEARDNVLIVLDNINPVQPVECPTARESDPLISSSKIMVGILPKETPISYVGEQNSLVFLDDERATPIAGGSSNYSELI